jgi:hypothetical protein
MRHVRDGPFQPEAGLVQQLLVFAAAALPAATIHSMMVSQLLLAAFRGYLPRLPAAPGPIAA